MIEILAISATTMLVLARDWLTDGKPGDLGRLLTSRIGGRQVEVVEQRPSPVDVQAWIEEHAGGEGVRPEDVAFLEQQLRLTLGDAEED